MGLAGLELGLAWLGLVGLGLAGLGSGRLDVARLVRAGLGLERAARIRWRRLPVRRWRVPVRWPILVRWRRLLIRFRPTTTLFGAVLLRRRLHVPH